MIKIKKEIVEQVKRSMSKDYEYIPKILERLDTKIRGMIDILLESGHRGPKMFVAFYESLSNGLENLGIPKEFDNFEYCKEIAKYNPEIAKFIVEMYATNNNQLWVMVVLYRFFESELEVRSLKSLNKLNEP